VLAFCSVWVIPLEEEGPLIKSLAWALRSTVSSDCQGYLAVRMGGSGGARGAAAAGGQTRRWEQQQQQAAGYKVTSPKGIAGGIT